MKTILATTCCLALLAGFAMAGPIQAQGCVDFQGIDHCPVGDAVVERTGTGGISVSGLGPEGNDGVSSSFAPTTFWQARMDFPTGAIRNNRIHLSSISAGESTSELYLEPVDDQFQIRAEFTGDAANSTYSVLVYNQGVLQGALGSFSSQSVAPAAQSAATAVPGGLESFNDEVRITLYIDGIRIGTFDVDWIIFHFGIANTGGCGWGMNLGQSVAVSLPDGNQVMGDEIRFQEDVNGPGHYPYLGFESIETRTTMRSFTVTEEIAEGTE